MFKRSAFPSSNTWLRRRAPARLEFSLRRTAFLSATVERAAFFRFHRSLFDGRTARGILPLKAFVVKGDKGPKAAFSRPLTKYRASGASRRGKRRLQQTATGIAGGCSGRFACGACCHRRGKPYLIFPGFAQAAPGMVRRSCDHCPPPVNGFFALNALPPYLCSVFMIFSLPSLFSLTAIAPSLVLFLRIEKAFLGPVDAPRVFAYKKPAGGSFRRRVSHRDIIRYKDRFRPWAPLRAAPPLRSASARVCRAFCLQAPPFSFCRAVCRICGRRSERSPR